MDEPLRRGERLAATQSGQQAARPVATRGSPRSNIFNKMAKAFHPLRSRFIRLLASVLVVAALLGNGLAMAQTQSMMAGHGGCAEMSSPGHHGHCCDKGGKPCPVPHASCDDQCMFRCQSSAVLALTVLAVPVSDRAQALLPPLSPSETPPAVIAPGLRPPISA